MAEPRWLIPLFAAGCLAAQTRPEELLTYDLSAVDGRGNLVSDLRAEEFRVTDAGRRQTIAYLRRGQDVTLREPVLSHERSNAAYGTFPHVTAVLLDLLNGRAEVTKEEWETIAGAFRRGEWEQDTYFYMLMKNGVLYPIHALPDSWTESRARNRPWARDILPQFEEMWDQYRARPAELADRSTQRMHKAAGATVVAEMHNPDAGDIEARKKVQAITTTAVQELATRLAGVPGSKSIVWITAHGGSPLRGNPTEWIEEAKGASLDPVPIYYVVEPSQVESTIRRALADAQRGYRIGYFPPAANWDGRPHEVRITCTRPGVRVRGKTSYNAVRAVDIEDDRRQTTPGIIAASPFDASTIRFRVDVQGDLRVNADDVLFEASVASLAVQAIEYLEGEREVSQEPMIVDFRHDGPPIRFTLPRYKPDSEVRIVVLDRTTQSFGTLTIPAGGIKP